MSFFTSLNNRTFLGLTIAAVITCITTPVAADTTTSSGTGATGSADSGVLQQIATYTNGTLTALTTGSLSTTLIADLNNLISPDSASDSPVSTYQQDFTSYNNQITASSTAQTALQPQLTSNLFTGVVSGGITYADDLSFSSLMGVATPVTKPNLSNPVSTDSGYNYLQYASASNISHKVPDPTWKGLATDQTTYTNFFNTSYAAQSFNAYALSQIYEDIKNGVPAAQTTLVTLAGNSSWFASVASESIGAVLRQTLMFQSQSYILLTQILQTQKMLLTAQIMNNSLTVLQNMATESILSSRAIQRQPGT